MRPDQIRVGQMIRLHNAVRAKVLVSEPLDQDYWHFRLEPIRPRDIGAFDHVILRTARIDVVTLEVVR
jgi:hypothetical protein